MKDRDESRKKIYALSGIPLSIALISMAGSNIWSEVKSKIVATVSHKENSTLYMEGTKESPATKPTDDSQEPTKEEPTENKPTDVIIPSETVCPTDTPEPTDTKTVKPTETKKASKTPTQADTEEATEEPTNTATQLSSPTFTLTSVITKENPTATKTPKPIEDKPPASGGADPVAEKVAGGALLLSIAGAMEFVRRKAMHGKRENS